MALFLTWEPLGEAKTGPALGITCFQKIIRRNCFNRHLLTHQDKFAETWQLLREGNIQQTAVMLLSPIINVSKNSLLMWKYLIPRDLSKCSISDRNLTVSDLSNVPPTEMLFVKITELFPGKTVLQCTWLVLLNYPRD